MAKQAKKTNTQEPSIEQRTTVDHTIPGTTVVMQRAVTPHAMTPKKQPFLFPQTEVADIALAMQLGMNIMLTGPTGCGKTALPTALCAELGLPLVRFNCDGETRVSNLRGMNVPAAKDGVLTLQFNEGDLAKCMREGMPVMLDEVDASTPGVRFVLQPVLEEGNRTLHIPETGETIRAAPGFCLFATGNTIGFRASRRAQYAGTNAMNAAFLDRFGCVISCDYPTREVEYERILVNVPGCDTELIDGICRVASELRADKSFASDFSTRRCIQWARLTQHYGALGVVHAAELSVLRKLENATDARVAREVIGRSFGYGSEGEDA